MKNIQVSELLKTLIDIPSVTGEEAKIGTFIAEYLKRIQFDVSLIPVDGKRCNVYATTGTPRIMLQAHMDVVPPYIPATEDEKYIYGRGACDTKGSIASMLIATNHVKEKGVSNFGLLFTVDEEVGFTGAKMAASVLQDKNTVFVVGEPTQLQPVTAHFGILVLKLIATGKTSHSSEPQLGVNAIDALVAELHGPVKAFTPYSGTLMSIVGLSGGVADNIIPDRAEALLSFRIAPNDLTDYEITLRKLVEKGVTVEKVQELRPVSSVLPASLQFLGEGKQVKYCTELNFFKNGFVFGPGDIAYAHTPDEKISKTELSQAVVLFEKILMKY